MQIYIYASGSRGNISVISNQESTFLIDCGITVKKLKEKLKQSNLSLNQIDKIFITHEHTDHILGLKGLLSLGTIKTVYITQGTLNALSDEVKELLPNIYIIKADSEYVVDNFLIKTIELSHDANEPVGFIFEHNQKKVVHLTDTGYVHHSYNDLIKDANLYILESNHCPVMLMRSKRQYHLKQRILGQLGHLSNEDAASLINKVATKDCIWVVSHISSECNSQLAIEKAIVKMVNDLEKIEVVIAKQDDHLVFNL